VRQLRRAGESPSDRVFVISSIEERYVIFTY
jgi:hypothetical protein